MRTFSYSSTWDTGNLALAIAPALTPAGIEENPLFFKGEASNPLMVSRGLLVLADIVSTRYFQYKPIPFYDPILSAQGDMVRAECFSACNGVYARLDLLQDALYGEIAFGTTNVDIGLELRKSLMRIKQEDRLRLRIGETGLQALHTVKKDLEMTRILHQRPVEMPERWIKALGNCVMIHKNMKKVFEVKGILAKNFIAMLPAVSGKELSGWLTYFKTGVRLMPRQGKNAVYISGLHRLSAIKRLMSEVESIDFYAPYNGEKGPMMVEVGLQGARLVLSLTAQSYQGYSGEGALLEGLVKAELLENTENVASVLQFESKIEPKDLEQNLDLSESEVEAALSVLAVSGKLGYDTKEQAYFHRELPEEPERILKDNRRLEAAKKLLKHVKKIDEHCLLVKSGDVDYRVTYQHGADLSEAKCTCTWYLKYKNYRGPCKHILAVKLVEDME